MTKTRETAKCTRQVANRSGDPFKTTTSQSSLFELLPWSELPCSDHSSFLAALPDVIGLITPSINDQDQSNSKANLTDDSRSSADARREVQQ